MRPPTSHLYQISDSKDPKGFAINSIAYRDTSRGLIAFDMMNVIRNRGVHFLTMDQRQSIDRRLAGIRGYNTCEATCLGIGSAMETILANKLPVFSNKKTTLESIAC